MTTRPLNVAAVGAQCGRVSAKLDPDLAQRRLAAARAVWAPALAKPDCPRTRT